MEAPTSKTISSKPQRLALMKRIGAFKRVANMTEPRAQRPLNRIARRTSASTEAIAPASVAQLADPQAADV